MRLDENFYKRKIDKFKFEFEKNFGDRIAIINEVVKFEARGYFKLTYCYYPSNYIIEVENEIKTFIINIFDGCAQNMLYRIRKFNNELDDDNIKHAIKLLNDILTENKFNMYIYDGDNVYKRSNGKLFKVQDIRDIT